MLARLTYTRKRVIIAVTLLDMDYSLVSFVLFDLVFGRVLGGLLQPLVAGGELGPRLRDGLHGGPGHRGRGGGAEMDQSEPGTHSWRQCRHPAVPGPASISPGFGCISHLSL